MAVFDVYGYIGETYDGEGEYDRILYFTDRVVRYTATKQNTTRYKVAKGTLVFDLTYSEHDDGCLTLGNTDHYKLVGRISADYPPQVRHNHNNAVVSSQITDYNNSIKRLNCIAPEYEDEYFNKSSIGDSYFVADVKKKAIYSEGVYSQIWGEVIPRETSVFYGCFINRVDLVAEDRTETESHTAVTYIARDDAFYDDDRNTITEERGQSICDWYTEQGYDILTNETGISLLAYIKDGKIVTVE